MKTLIRLLCLTFLYPATAGAQVIEYYHLDGIGNVRVVTDSAGAIVERHDYLPFGEEWSPTGGAQSRRFTGKERDAESGLDYFGARYYGSKIGRFTTIDPVYTWRENLIDPQRWNRYAYAKNNPLRYIDPDGRSTITAQDGTVIDVRNDRDLGVYRGTDRVGETSVWDEFRAHDGETGAVKPNVIPDARIDFGSSWDAAIATSNAYADVIGFKETAERSRLGGFFDIKSDLTIAPYGVGTGRLLNGKYATAQSAGNYLYGLNTATGTLPGGGKLTRDQAMRLAGALQQGYGSKIGLARAFAGKAFGPAPYYGETPHAGRRIDEGFAAGRR